MKHSPKQITLDLAEWIEIQSELNSLKAVPTGEELTEVEHQEATGMLLIRSLQNPGLFREVIPHVDLGKYKAIFVRAAINDEDKPAALLVKFVRTQ